MEQRIISISGGTLTDRPRKVIESIVFSSHVSTLSPEPVAPEASSLLSPIAINSCQLFPRTLCPIVAPITNKKTLGDFFPCKEEDPPTRRGSLCLKT